MDCADSCSVLHRTVTVGGELISIGLLFTLPGATMSLDWLVGAGLVDASSCMDSGNDDRLGVKGVVVAGVPGVGNDLMPFTYCDIYSVLVVPVIIMIFQ